MLQKDIYTLKSQYPRYTGDFHKITRPKFEVTVHDCTFIRIGISHKDAKRHLPIGSCMNSYSYSSRGYKYHNRRRELYGEPFGRGDVIGVEIGLDDIGYVRFYKNGIDQGVAYWNTPMLDVYAGYGMYGNCEIEVNHGMFQVYCEDENDMLVEIWE